MLKPLYLTFAWVCCGLLAACSGLPQKQQAQTSLVELAASIQTEKECRAYAGEWRKVGKLQQPACVLTAHDAGKMCSDSEQCQVACLAKETGAKIGTSVAGQCASTTVLFGCRTYVSSGKAEPTLCID